MEIAAPKAAADWEEPLARVGLCAKGVSYALVGVLAIGVAAGIGGQSTSRSGALESLADSTFGKVVLVLLFAGFAAYALWRVVQAWQDDGWGKRLGHLGRAAIYVALSYSTARILVGAGEQSQNAKAHKATALVLQWPGGRELVIAGGLVAIGAGLWNLYRGIAKKFEDKWRNHSSTGSLAGVVGHVARFVVFALIGVFAIRAAAQYDPQEAVGLDGALQKLAHASYGSALLGLTAAGLLAYGLYCFVDARYRDVTR
jgi:hypothetical protein